MAKNKTDEIKQETVQAYSKEQILASKKYNSAFAQFLATSAN